MHSTLEYDCLDNFLEDEDLTAEASWVVQAMEVLRSFLSQVGKREFTAAEFRRWSDYYCNLSDPHDRIPWNRVFNSAKQRGMIRAAGRTMSRSGATQVGGTRWVAG